MWRSGDYMDLLAAKKEKRQFEHPKLKNKMNSQNLNSQTGHPKFEQPKKTVLNQDCGSVNQFFFFFFRSLIQWGQWELTWPCSQIMWIYVGSCGIHMKHPLLAFGGMVNKWSGHAVFFLLWMGYEVEDCNLQISTTLWLVSKRINTNWGWFCALYIFILYTVCCIIYTIVYHSRAV